MWQLASLSLLLHAAVAAASCRFTVDEEVPVGASIEGSNLFDRCFNKPQVRGDSVTLRGLGDGAEWLSGLLAVSPSGSLKVGRTIDREDPRLGCRARSPCVRSFEAQLQNPSSPTRMALTRFDLFVMDKNDNSPQFGGDGRVLQVKENSMTRQLPLPVVTDADAGTNGRTVTRILSCSEPSRAGKDILARAESGQPYLMVGQGLDFEALKSYQLTLEACDTGLQRRCNQTTVEVCVLDENDNAPQFEMRQYQLGPVPEDAHREGQPAREIGRVRAADLDSGENGRVRYWLETGPANFSVEPETGAVQLIGRVDVAGGGVVELEVRATDHGQPALTDTTRVQLRVTDVNDHSPEILLISPSGGSERPAVPENSAPGLFAYVKAADRDMDDNGRVDCQLGAGAASFAMGPPAQTQDTKLFRINTTRAYDREAQASDVFEVVCRDHGSPARTSSVRFEVEIGDVNEFAPTFNRSVFYGRVAEGLPAGSPVAQVTAHDGDATAVLTFDFRDEGTAKGCFQIDRHSGRISTLRQLDREAVADFPSGQPVYTVSVQVSDGERTATAQVEITVTDVNDNPPVVTGPHLLEVNETFGDASIQDALVGQLTFEDLDDPATLNAKVTFSLKDVVSPRRRMLNATAAMPRFRVDSSGKAWATGRLDREACDQHLLLVSVRDFGSPPMSSSATVTVSLLDLNDHPPVVLRPLQNEVINITNDHTPGVLVLQLEVQDLDLCLLPHPLSGRDCVLSGRFHMQLQQQKPGGMFQLDSATGSLRVLSSLTADLFPLAVTVTDTGSPRAMSTTVRFAVRVESRADGSLFAPSWGPSSNWTVLLVIVGASSLITVILVVAIVLLTRRQPCVLGRSGRRGYGGPKDRHQQPMHQMQPGTGPPDTDVGPSQLLVDGAGPLTTFGQGVGHQDTLRRENGSGSYALHYGPHNPCLYPPGDYDVASADSGHGASEEEMLHLPPGAVPQDHQQRYSTLNLASAAAAGQLMMLRSRSPMCNCILEEDAAHPQCQERVPLTHCSRQPLTLLSEPQFAAVSLQTASGYRSLSRQLGGQHPYGINNNKSAAV